MADTQFRAVLTLEDRASMPLRGLAATIASVNAGIEASNAQVAARFAGLRTATSQLGGELGRLGNNTGFVRLLTHTRALGGEIHSLTRNTLGAVTTLLPALAGLGAIGGAAGLIDVVHGAVDAAGKMEDLTLMTGQTAEALAQMRFAAAMVGTDFEGAAVPAINKLTLSVAEARAGSDEAMQAFRNMGISARMLANDSTADIFGRMSDSFARVQARVESGAITQATATQFFQRQARQLMGRGGIEEIKMLKEFREHQAEMRRLAVLSNRRDAGGNLIGTITAAERGQMDKLGDTFSAIGLMVGQIRMAIGRELTPVLLPVAEHLRDWLAVNRELIATRFAAFVRDTKNYLMGIDWPKLIDGAKGFGAGVVKLVDNLGGLTTVAKGLVVLTGVRLVGSLAASATAIAGVTTVVAAAVGPVTLLVAGLTSLVALLPVLRRTNAEAAGQSRYLNPFPNDPFAGVSPGDIRRLPPARRGSLRSAQPIEGFEFDVDGYRSREAPWWEGIFTPPAGRPAPRRLLDLYQPQSAPPLAARDGTFTFRFENVPPGLRLFNTTAGPGAPNLEVGYGFAP